MVFASTICFGLKHCGTHVFVNKPVWLLGWTTEAVTPVKDMGQCVSCFYVEKGGETTTAAHTGIASTNVLVYSCVKLFLLLVLSLPSLKNHRGRPRCMSTTCAVQLHHGRPGGVMPRGEIFPRCLTCSWWCVLSSSRKGCQQSTPLS